MNITKYIKHFDSLTNFHVLAITRSGGHTLISRNYRSETGSEEMLFHHDQSSCGRSCRPLHVDAPSMWAEWTPPPCGLGAAPSMWAPSAGCSQGYLPWTAASFTWSKCLLISTQHPENSKHTFLKWIKGFLQSIYLKNLWNSGEIKHL